MNMVEVETVDHCLDLTNQLLTLSEEVTKKQVELMKKFLDVYNDNPTVFRELTKNQSLKKLLESLFKNFSHNALGVKYLLEEFQKY